MNKMSRIIQLLITFLFITSCGEKTREEIVARYDDGKKKTIMHFIGKDPDEQMIERIEFSPYGDTLIWEKPTQDFIRRRTYKDGEVINQETYKNGKKHGKQIFYKDQEKFQESYQYDVKDGKFIQYYKNGNMALTETYIEGKIAGKRTKYWENGNKQSIQNYVNGLKTGEWILYFENGKPRLIETYDGIKHPNDNYDGLAGKYVVYYENGQIFQDLFLENSFIWADGYLPAPNGKQTSYYRDGSIKSITNYIKNWDDGDHVSYFKDGSIEEFLNTEDLILTSYYQNGNIQRIVKIKDGTAKYYHWSRGDSLLFDMGEYQDSFKSYYENGQVKKEANYKNDKLEGPYTLYHENGQVKEETNYKNREREGYYISYYQNGQIKNQGTYKYNRKKDMWIEYYENGQVKEEGRYDYWTWDDKGNIPRQDYKDGPWRWYYENGQLKEEGTYIKKSGYGLQNKHGIWISYTKDGMIQWKGLYENGNYIRKPD